MTVTLTEAGKNALNGTAGFGADGVSADANDQIDILAGFSRDLAGNVGEGDAAALTLTKDQYTDSTGPTVQMFAAVRVDQSDGTIDGWTADEIAALTVGDDTSALDAALAQAQAVFGDGYTEIAVGDAKLLDGDFTVGGKIGIMAGLSEAILAEGTLTADLNSSSSAEVTLETISTDAADGDGALGAVNSDLLFGVYTVADNENVTGLSIEEFAQSGVKDIYGNTMTTLTVPQTGNIDDNSTINIDALAPTNTITGASYNPTTGVITFTGTNFTTIAATSVEDITLYMDWTKIWWDIDGDRDTSADGDAENTPDVSDFVFDGSSSGNIANTTVVSGGTQMTVTLTEAGKNALNGTAGFGADGVSADANDQIDILAGFSRDLAGNVGADDAAALTLTKDQYTDSTGPTVQMFAAVRVDQSDGTIDGWTADEIAALTVGDDTSALDAALAQAQAVFGDGYTEIAVGDVKLLDGDFTVAGKIGIMAGLSETILAEGTLTADLNSSSSAEVTLSTITTDAADGDEATGDVNSDLLFGVYTVADNENVTGLSIEEFTQSGVKDIYGNTMTTLTVPQTGNIDDNSSINVDTAAPTNTITGASYNPATGVITFTGTNFTTIAAASDTNIANQYGLDENVVGY